MALNAGEQLSGGEVVDASGRMVVVADTLPSSVGTVRPGTMLIVGTSLEQNEGSDWPLTGTARLNPNVLASPSGPIYWASWFQGSTLRIIKNAAASGVTSDQQIVNSQNPVSVQYALGLNPAPGFIYLGHVTGDDPGTLTAAASAVNDLTLYTLLRSTYPQAIIVLPTMPANNLNTNNWTTRATVNAQRRLLALQNTNTLLFDFESYFINPTTGLPPAAYSTDNIHPNPTGAQVLGKALGALLAPFLPGKSMVNDYTNDTRVTSANGGWGTDAMMSGTPGANTTATNWTFQGPTGAVRNLVARTDQFGNWQEMIYGGTAGAMKVFRALTAVATNAVIQAECELSFLGTLPATGVTDISFVASLGNAGFSSIGSSAALGDTLGNRGNYADPGSGTVLTLRTPPVVVAAGMSASASFLTLQVNGTATAGGIRLGRCSLIRLA